MVYRCSVNGCDADGNNSKMHKFPSPSSNPEKFQAWVRAIKGDIEKMEPCAVFSAKKICSRHFETKFFRAHSKKLFPHAIPTLFVKNTNVELIDPLASTSKVIIPSYASFEELISVSNKRKQSASGEATRDEIDSSSTDEDVKETRPPFRKVYMRQPKRTPNITSKGDKENVAGTSKSGDLDISLQESLWVTPPEKLHNFPCPKKDRERFNKWVKVIGGPITEHDPDFVYFNRRVCGRHFEVKCLRKPSLKMFPHAVPTLLLPEKSAESSQERSVANLPASPLSSPSNNYLDDDSDDDPDYPDPKRKRGTATDTDDDSDDSDDPGPKRTLVTATDTGLGKTADAVDCNVVKKLITSDISKPHHIITKKTNLPRLPIISVEIQTEKCVNDSLQSATNNAVSTVKQYEKQQETSGNHVGSNKHPIVHEFHDQNKIMSKLMQHKKQQEILKEKIVSNTEPIAFKFPNTDEYYMHGPLDEKEEQDSNSSNFYKVEMLDSPSVKSEDMEDREIEEGEIEAKDEELHKFSGFVFNELKSLKSEKTINYVIDLVTNILMKAHLGEYDGVGQSNESRIDGTEYA